MNLLGSLCIAFSMYSAIPVPQVEWTKERMRYAMCFFPLIGIVIGSLLAFFYMGAQQLNLGRLCFTALGTALPLVITGGIHMDGFLDVTDARRSFEGRERKLEILKDPHTGAFAIIGFGIYMLLYAGAFSELQKPGIHLFAGSFVLTRALSGLSVVSFPMAKKDGLAAAFSDGAVKKTVQVTMLLFLICASIYLIFCSPIAGGLILAAAGGVFLWYYWVSVKEFGGITGDLAGWFLQLCELAALAVAAFCS